MLCRYLNRALFVGALALCAILLCGCSTAENLEVDQRTAIEKYLDGQKIKYSLQSGVYVQILNEDREDYTTSQTVVKGDALLIDFAVFEFNSGLKGLFYTNVQSMIGANSGLNTQYWDFTTRKVTLGSSSLVRGLDLGLANSRVGDSLHIFMPAILGYGTEYNGVVPGNTPLVWAIKIKSVSSH